MCENPLEDRGHILIADDNPDDLQYIVTVLREHGYIPHATTDPNVALAFARNNAPDLILLDMHMPEMDGLETLQRLASRAPSLPVIMVTVNDDVETTSRLLQLGAADYVPKPFNLEYLEQAINIQLSATRD